MFLLITEKFMLLVVWVKKPNFMHRFFRGSTGVNFFHKFRGNCEFLIPVATHFPKFYTYVQGCLLNCETIVTS